MGLGETTVRGLAEKQIWQQEKLKKEKKIQRRKFGGKNGKTNCN
jgi:hypothetical protein